ncbi:conserved exported hypothetical protein [Candidatus Sulfopaludibacter sp. SbA3]|nr:conserved exported hypothetical protein [Candidatus Sulfopaludibacter sp. SbA3]
MRTLAGSAIALLCCCIGFAQYRGNVPSVQPYVAGGFGSAVYPAGTAATNPGIQRFTPNVVYPGGGGPRLVVPNANGNGNFQRRGNGGSYLYAYPVYVGSYGSSVYDSSAYGAGGQAPQQPNVTIIMPPQQPPVIINQYDAPPRPQMTVFQPDTAPAATPQAEESAPEAPHYLLAFKDHTIYSAVAYWVDGDTLHYFTAGNTHNQVSMSLIDRAMTERLNKDTGADLKLPAAK